MLQQVPELFPDNYLLTYDFYIYIAVIIVGFIGSAIFIKRAQKSVIPTQKAIFKAMGLMLLGLTFMRILYIGAVRWPDANYDTWTILGYTVALIGLGTFLYEFEKYIVTKTKFLMTIITGIAIITTILGLLNIVDRTYPRLIGGYVSALDTFLVIFVYLYLIKISTGIIRKRTIITFFGIFLLFAGVMLDSEIFFEMWTTMPLILPPILCLAGLLIMIPIMRF